MFKDSLRKYLYINNISQLDLSNKIGDSQQAISDFLKKDGTPQAKTRLKYFENLVGFKEFYEKQEKTRNNKQQQTTTNNNKQQKTTYEKEKKVPYYDIDVTSTITTSFNDVTETPTFYVDYQPFNDCTAYVNNYGDSMFPKYKNGEKLAVKQIQNLDVLMYGETYLVVTNENANNLKTVKEVHYHNDPSKLILRASNPAYKGDTIIDKEDILSMFAVKGKISQNFI